ncbi:hypothetical protein PG997_014673 [Apiospora hydei]|uniref:2EXR domain-containing protein n=1 Tax=Apiospora hydei TaxID=1337664 RepID=A0ABR1UUI5_9PEZI
MASASVFSLFPELPTEIRLLIWEQAVLEEYRDRILLVEHRLRRIVITRELQQPFRPIFHASRESREVANALYPVRLPVHVFSNRAACWHEAVRYELALPRHDTFLFGMEWWRLRSFQPAVPAARFAGRPLPANFANLRFVFESKTCKPVEVQDPHKGFVGAFVTAELTRPLVRAIRNLVAVVHGAPREDGQTSPSTAGVHCFRKAPTYRRLHLVGEDSFRLLHDQLSFEVNAAMDWAYLGEKRDNPSYNGRAVLRQQDEWKVIVTCDNS